MGVLLSLSFITMSCFCLAMEKHRKQIIMVELNACLSCFFRPLAWVLLISTFYMSSQLYGWTIGPVVFFGMLIGSLVPLILLLTYRAKAIPLVAILLPIVVYIS
ncbi:MAG: DUF3325 domain-containing protein [Colwellia sp.]